MTLISACCRLWVTPLAHAVARGRRPLCALCDFRASARSRSKAYSQQIL